MSRPRRCFLLLVLSAFCASGASEYAVAGSHADGGGGSGDVCTTGGHDKECTNNGSDDARHLLNNGTRALMEEKNYRKANSIFEDIAVQYPNWEQMYAVQKYNGLALSQLGKGSKALWCFKNAMTLANVYPGKQVLQQEANGNGYKLFVSDTSQIVQATALQFWNKVTGTVDPRVPPDATLLYSAVSLAYGVGRVNEAQMLNDVLLQIDPEHGGARLLAATIALDGDGSSKKGRLKLRDAVQNFEQFPWDAAMAWSKIGSIECGMDSKSNRCINAWLEAFNYATSCSPVDREIATTAAVNAANSMLARGRSVEEVRRLGDRAVRLGLLNAPLQLPGQLMKGISFSPFRDDARGWKAVRHLEQHYRRIRDEILSVYESGSLSRNAKLDGEGLQTAGDWRQLNIVDNGRANGEAMNLLPYTSKVVNALRDANSMVLGGSKVSVMEPGTVVRPHTGQTNARLRIHLGIRIPEGAFIRVDNETRTWTEGRCVVIDDSYVHEVWHNGDEKRIVLIVDVWHLEMDSDRKEDSIAATNEAFLEMYRYHEEDPKMALVRQGVPAAVIPDRFISEHDD